MSESFNCRCQERQKPVRERAWRVTQRNCHHSAFAGGRRTYSQYSTVICLACPAAGRTKANYVRELPDFDRDEGWWKDSGVSS